MKKSRFTESQIVAVLKEGDAGMPVAELCRKHGISNATYYLWKSKYSGVQATWPSRFLEQFAPRSIPKVEFAQTCGRVRDTGGFSSGRLLPAHSELGALYFQSCGV